MQIGKATGFEIDIVADLHKWRAFVAIGELGSLSRAAIFLDSNQSLLSRQLNALERECGARLFNRTGRGVELSETGQRLFAQVSALLNDAQALELQIRAEVSDPMGRVTLGLLPSVSTLLGGRLYPIIRRLHPGVRLKIMEGGSSQLDEWLADEVVDIAIRYRYGASLLEHEQALAMVDSYLVGPPGDAITAQPQVRFDALRNLPLVLPSERNGLRNGLDAFARQQRTTVVPVIESDSMPLQKLLIVQEHLYTVLPIHAVWEEVRDGTLQAAHICDPPFQRTLAMSFARTKGPARAVTAIAQHICEIFDELAASGMWERDSE